MSKERAHTKRRGLRVIKSSQCIRHNVFIHAPSVPFFFFGSRRVCVCGWGKSLSHLELCHLLAQADEPLFQWLDVLFALSEEVVDALSIAHDHQLVGLLAEPVLLLADLLLDEDGLRDGGHTRGRWGRTALKGAVRRKGAVRAV